MRLKSLSPVKKRAKSNMKNSSVQPLGVYEITLKGADGQIKEHFFSKNLVVQTGKNIIASLLVADGKAKKPSKMQVGTSSVPVEVSDVALKSPVASNPVTLVETETKRINNQVTYTATFPIGTAIGTLCEVGIFAQYDSDADGTTLFSRSVFPPITKEQDDELTIRWAITIA